MNRLIFSLLIILGLMGCVASVDVPAAEEAPSIPSVETGTLSRMLIHDDLERTYIVYVPESANSGEPLPLLLNLHGFTGTSESQMNYADFRPIAEREGFLLVYPQGTLLGSDTHWNVGSWTRESTVDDVGFLSLLIDTLTIDYNIDESRVYSIGHSNGGYMSFQLACQIGDQITAVASISGTMTPENFAACAPSHTTPILQIHGTADSVVPYTGASWTKSVDEVIEYWVGINDLETEPIAVEIAPSDASTATSNLVRMRYASTEGQYLVEHIMVEKGGHEWLGQSNARGQMNQDIDTNEEIWAFLSQFDLDELE